MQKMWGLVTVERKRLKYFFTLITIALSTFLFLPSRILLRCLLSCWITAACPSSLHSARQHFSVLLLVRDMWQSCGQCTVSRSGDSCFRADFFCRGRGGAHKDLFRMRQEITTNCKFQYCYNITKSSKEISMILFPWILGKKIRINIQSWFLDM